MPASTEVKYFHHAMKGAPVISAEKGSVVRWLNAVLVDGFGEQTVTSVSVSGNVATVTCAGHGLQKHWVISISGATPTQLNGEHRITKAYKDTFQFETVGVADGAATGTIKFKIAPAGWKKVAQSADGFKAVYKSERLGFDQPLFMADDTEERQEGFKIFTMSWFDNFDSYDKSQEGAYRARCPKKNYHTNKLFWAMVANDHFCYPTYCNDSSSGFTSSNGYSRSLICCFGAMKTTKANNKYNGVIGGAIDSSSYYNGMITTSDRASDGVFAASSSSALLQRNYTSIGEHIYLAPYTTVNRGGLGFINESDYSIYIERPLWVSNNVAYGYMPGLYYSPMSFRPSDTEPVFVEDVTAVKPDNLLIWMPTYNHGIYLNATKW